MKDVSAKAAPETPAKKWDRAHMSSLIPGFSIIKNKVITPLLVATERVVDYIISEDKSKLKAQNQNTNVTN
jgi:hypothetical protein